jgi:hypothetical protein
VIVTPTPSARLKRRFAVAMIVLSAFLVLAILLPAFYRAGQNAGIIQAQNAARAGRLQEQTGPATGRVQDD